jgi:hypothetical protein
MLVYGPLLHGDTCVLGQAAEMLPLCSPLEEAFHPFHMVGLKLVKNIEPVLE